MNNYGPAGAGNSDPLSSWLAYRNFYRRICDALQKTLTFKTLIFHLNELRDLYLVLCSLDVQIGGERRSRSQLWKQKIVSEP